MIAPLFCQPRTTRRQVGHAVAVTGLLLAILVGSVGARAQDAGNGKALFASICAACHTAKPNRNLIGPSLFGVVNRPSGHVPGFRYSDANRRSGLTWNVSTLDIYLTAPRKLVPGTLMTYPGLKNAKQRADVIAYLATLH